MVGLGPDFIETKQMLIDSGSTLAGSGSNSSNLGQLWPRSGQLWSILGQLWPTPGQSGQFWPTFDEIGPTTSVETGSNLANSGQHGRCWLNVSHTLGTFGPSSLKSTGLGPIAAEIGRDSARFGQTSTCIPRMCTAPRAGAFNTVAQVRGGQYWMGGAKSPRNWGTLCPSWCREVRASLKEAQHAQTKQPCMATARTASIACPQAATHRPSGSQLCSASQKSTRCFFWGGCPSTDTEDSPSHKRNAYHLGWRRPEPRENARLTRRTNATCLTDEDAQLANRERHVYPPPDASTRRKAIRGPSATATPRGRPSRAGRAP